MTVGDDTEGRKAAGNKATGAVKGAGFGQNEPVTVGAQLKTARIAQRKKLAAVAADLCLREEYLAAIEAEEYQKIPPHPYSTGFVRAYARYLNLDVEALVAQFKIHEQAHENRGRLVFSLPASEEHAPGRKILAASLVVAVAGYGLWYYSFSGQDNTGSVVAPVPDRLAAQIEDDGEFGNTQPGNNSMRADAHTIEPGRVGDGGESDNELSSAPIERRPDELFQALPSETVEPANVQDAAADRNVETAAITKPQEEAGGVDGSPDLSSTAATPQPMTSIEATPEEKVLGILGGSSRITIRARRDSWVRIIGSDDEILLSQVLRSGDSYHMPDRNDLIMSTGNAGALDVFVDGVGLGPLGAEGMVRREVALNVEALLAGAGAP